MSHSYNFVTDLDAATTTFENMCLHCRESNSIIIETSIYQQWRIERLYIQDLLPHLSPDHREILISGTHPHCWAEMWKEDLEDEATTIY